MPDAMGTIISKVIMPECRTLEAHLLQTPRHSERIAVGCVDCIGGGWTTHVCCDDNTTCKGRKTTSLPVALGSGSHCTRFYESFQGKKLFGPSPHIHSFLDFQRNQV